MKSTMSYIATRILVGFLVFFPLAVAGLLLARILAAHVLSGRGSCGGHGRIAGGRVRLDGPEASSVQELEEGLGARALDIT